MKKLSPRVPRQELDTDELHVHALAESLRGEDGRDKGRDTGNGQPCFQRVHPSRRAAMGAQTDFHKEGA